MRLQSDESRMSAMGGKLTLGLIGWQDVANPAMRLVRLRHINASFAEERFQQFRRIPSQVTKPCRMLGLAIENSHLPISPRDLPSHLS